MNLPEYLLSKIKNTPLNSLVNDFDKREIVKGAGTTFILKIFGLSFSYVFNIFLARWYGAEVMGIFALALTVAGIFSLFAQMGTQTSTVRFVAQYAGQGDFNAVKNIYKKTVQLVLPLSIFLAVLFYFLSPFIAHRIFHKTLLVVPLKITAFVLPFTTIMGINTASLRGLKRIKDALIFSTIIPPILNTVGLMGITYLVMRNYLTPIYVNLITIFIGSIYSLIIWLKTSKALSGDNFENNKEKDIINKREIIKVSMPMFMTAAMTFIMGWTDIFMLGIFRDSAEVGIYRLSLRLALLTSIATGAIYSIIAPKFSELYFSNQKDKLKIVSKFSSKIMFFLAIPGFIVIILFAKPILWIFGKEFIVGATALIILSTGEFIKAIFGPIGFLLDMTDRQNIVRNAMLIGALSNIIFNFWLIPLFGISGAAFASVLSVVVWHIIASFSVYKNFGYWIGYLPSIKK